MRRGVPRHGRAVEIYGGLRVVARGAAVQNGHEMIVAAAQRTAAFQLALVRQKHAYALSSCGERRSAAGCACAEDKHVGLMGDDRHLSRIVHERPPFHFPYDTVMELLEAAQ